ncbi:MAG: outer membrane lipoprotein LolB [Burkholderiales bacterium]
MIRVSIALSALSLSLALLGCATPTPPVSRQTNAGEVLSGRLAVVVADLPTTHAGDAQPAPAQSLSAAFELRGSAQAGSLDLISPLGSIMAQAVWSPDGATLQSNRGRERYEDMDSLTRDMLGESLPVGALFDWLRGRPWGGAPSQPNKAPSPEGFTQLGWQVDLSRFAQAVVLAERERAPKVTLRARLDRP